MAIVLMAIGYGRIVIVGSRDVKDFKILFYDYTGNFPEGVHKFINLYLGKYLMNYDVDLLPITINLASDSALNLITQIIRDDPMERQVIVDFSQNPVVKVYLRKLFRETNIDTYVASISGDLRIYSMRGRDGGRVLLREREHGGFPEIYSRALRAQMKSIFDEHLYLLACGLISGEVTMDIQDDENELHLPTDIVVYPFRGLGRFKRSVGPVRKIAIIGCGALGTFYAIQLALMQNMRMMRFKEVVFVDPDEIELVNFNRQVLFWGDTIGEPKAEVMADRFQKMLYLSLIHI